jgi:rhodanese-related sulfurtransferase
MKKFFSIIAIALLAIGFIGCEQTTTTTVDTQFTAPETLAMADVDDYLFRADFQFVDVRNFDDQMADGWIRGFEIIPFFDYLEYMNILVRTDGWTYDGNQIKNESALRALFDEDKYIVLMCAGGTRAGFVKDALEDLGYDNVYNVGGLSAYSGDNRVFGDGEYEITMPHPATVGPLPEAINMADALIDYYASRSDVQFIDLRNNTDAFSNGWHKYSTVIPFFDFLEAQEILVRGDGWNFSASDIKNEQALRNIFDENANIILFCAGGTRAGYVKAALEHLGYENVWNAGAFGDYTGDMVINPFCEETGDNGGTGGC